ncbi:MAG: YfhO family protein, partial [Anaerolineae bacterium]|nr:YfhO family protein [Anaerolineae bacterium]
MNRRLTILLRSDAAAALLCALFALLIFQRIALDGMILARGDIYTYFYPYWAARSAALAAGHIPLWSPELFMGVPLLANSQIGTFYPLNWPLTPLLPPAAVTISLLLHAAWAMFGVYQLGKRTLRLSALPALLAGAVYGMGGYLGAQVEHVNQYQALAWMPWLFLLFHQARSLQGVLLLGGALALQLLAGHPQTVFISLVGLGLYALVAAWADGTAPSAGRRRDGIYPVPTEILDHSLPVAGWTVTLRDTFLHIARRLGILAAAGVLAALLAAPQLLPTLELVASSNRSGGLTPQQAMAFSFNPFLIGRGLLPSYEGLVFGEYVAYVGVIALALAVIGAFSRPLRWPWLLLLALAFALALGLYNPLYWPLTNLPGFSFFRVPARWLALLALATALLAGCGLQALLNDRPRLRLLLPILVLVGSLVAASFLSDRMAVDVIGPALPTGVTLLGWGAALVVALALIWLRHSAMLLVVAVIAELFLAAQIMPHNQVVPPDVYSAPRFTISQLRAYTADQTPPGRFLSITPLEFDPGDVAALQARYAGLNMSELGTRIALVATKMREVIAPNLALVWGLPTIDGFDGGLLPSDAYSAFTSLLLPPGVEPTTDGRLREMLALPECRGACIPEQRWLDLSNTRYLIVDKVGDIWHEDVAYDATFAQKLAAGET